MNRAHVFSMSYVLNMPKVTSGNSFVRGLGSDWQVSGIVQVQSGVNLIANNGNYDLQYGQDNLVDSNNVTLKANDNFGKLGTNGPTINAEDYLQPGRE